MDYLGEFRRENRASYFGLYGFASGVEVLRFYGFGNETEATGEPGLLQGPRDAVPRVPGASTCPSPGSGTSPSAPRSSTRRTSEDKDQFINQVNPYGRGDFGELAVHGILSWDGRDSAVSRGAGRSPRSAGPTSRRPGTSRAPSAR